MIINSIKLYCKKMKVKEIETKTILIKHNKIDPWFISYYGMNLYR